MANAWGSAFGSAWGASWGAAAEAPPVVEQILTRGGYSERDFERHREQRQTERGELRGMLEAAFADAPRAEAVTAAKAEHAEIRADGSRSKRVDWSGLIADLDACQRVLHVFAAELAKPQPKKAPARVYSEETVRAAIAGIEAQLRARRARHKRAAIMLLLH